MTDTRRIIVWGFCPGERTDAGAGGFDWAYDSSPARAKAQDSFENTVDEASDHSWYMAICHVPANLRGKKITAYIEERVSRLEPGFLMDPRTEANADAG